MGEGVIRTSPLGAFLKKGKKKTRVVHDLSYPEGESINTGISKENSTVQYVTVQDALVLCEQVDEAWLGKYDLQDAYLSCPVREEDKPY